MRYVCVISGCEDCEVTRKEYVCSSGENDVNALRCLFYCIAFIVGARESSSTSCQLVTSSCNVQGVSSLDCVLSGLSVHDG